MFANIYNLVVTTFKSIKAVGSIRNSTNPVLSLIDNMTNASDFEVLKLKPREDEIKDNVIYFFGDNSSVYYINKEMSYTNPMRVYEKDFAGFKDFGGQLVFQKIKDKIDGKDLDLDLDIFSQGAIYRFLLGKGKFVAGVKYAFHKHISIPYNNFEERFIAKHTLMHKAYRAVKNSFINICTCAVSETGARVLGLTVAVGLAVISGGTFLAVAAGVYAAGIGISIVRQTASKVRLNRLKEEADLLAKYALTYKQKLALSMRKKVKFKDNFFKEEKRVKTERSTIKRWGISSLKHLSTFGVEIGTPVVAAALAPISAVLQFSILVTSAAISTGVGVYLRKVEEDKKTMLKNVIKDAQEYPHIPEYKSMEELREYAKLQENQVKALEKMEILSSDINPTKEFNRVFNTFDVDIPQTSKFQEYKKALIEVVNPFDRTKEIKDSREVLNPIIKLSDTVKMYDLYHEESLGKLVNKTDVAALSCVKEGGKKMENRAALRQRQNTNNIVRH